MGARRAVLGSHGASRVYWRPSRGRRGACRGSWWRTRRRGRKRRRKGRRSRGEGGGAAAGGRYGDGGAVTTRDLWREKKGVTYENHRVTCATAG